MGYSIHPWYGWSTNYMTENFNNPTVGPIFKQLYVRQALQDVMDQPAVVKGAYHGFAYGNYGPVPTKPPNSDISSFVKSNPYPFNVKKAKGLITSHGWTIQHGVATCTSPGGGPHQCGTGVKSGAKLSFKLQYESGTPALNESMQTYKSNAAKAGIDISLSKAPFDTVIANAAPCKPGPKCTWQIENWGEGWIYSPDYYPTGGEIFGTGAGSNTGSYSNPKNDANIAATHLAPPNQSESSLTTYQNYLAKQLPVIWQPTPYYQVTLVKNGLHGVTPQNPLLDLRPENWYFTKGS
jgi:peptide/nickel transport system substrate-binding protein